VLLADELDVDHCEQRPLSRPPASADGTGRILTVVNFSVIADPSSGQLFDDRAHDIRNLYAHNFAGVADSAYFRRDRRVFKQGQPYALSSGTGTQFDGAHLVLNLDDLRHYTGAVEALLKHLDASWP
jgi:hypothetical protein